MKTALIIIFVWPFVAAFILALWHAFITQNRPS